MFWYSFHSQIKGSGCRKDLCYFNARNLLWSSHLSYRECLFWVCGCDEYYTPGKECERSERKDLCEYLRRRFLLWCVWKRKFSAFFKCQFVKVHFLVLIPLCTVYRYHAWKCSYWLNEQCLTFIHLYFFQGDWHLHDTSWGYPTNT